MLGREDDRLAHRKSFRRSLTWFQVVWRFFRYVSSLTNIGSPLVL